MVMACKDAPMRFSQHFRMSVTRRGEKELRLGAFIAQGVRQLGAAVQDAAESQAPERTILMIARSAQSPVVKSVAALAHEIAGAHVRVRLILARADQAGLEDTFIAAHAAAL